MKKSCITLLFAFLLLSSFGQSVPRMIKIGDELYDNHRYLEAIEFFEKISGIDKKNYRARYRLGNSYLESLRYAEAENTFKLLGNVSESENSYRAKSLYKYASILKTDYKFKAADSVFAFAISIADDQDLIELARKQKEGCLLALRQKESDRGFSIELMDEVSSSYHDFGAIFNSNNGQLVLATTRNLGGTQYQGSQFDGVLPDLTTYRFVRNKWRRENNFNGFDKLNTEWSEGSGSFTRDGNIFYFSSCQGKEGSDCAIMVSYFDDGKWSLPVALNEYINEKGSENKQPSISVTGDTLFFSSDRSGGFGGSDIWMSLRGLEEESWGPAINMGGVINSSENDISPYYSSAFGCLVFASNGHVGYGGYDVYAAKGESFYEPDLFNLGFPFNSPLDDIYFNISDTLGFLSSNRQDRQNLNIYSFHLNSEKLFMSLLISGESMIDGQVISRFRDVRSLDLFAFRVEDYQGYELFEPEKRVKPKPPIIESEPEVEEKEVLIADNLNEPYPSLEIRSPLKSNYSLDYEHLYFGVESTKLEPASKKAMQDLARQLNISKLSSIEILAYTDIDGPTDYNQKLSEKRGEAVKGYLTKLGIPREKIVVRARGEGQLSARTSWYSKMFSRRAEIIVNTDTPLVLEQAKPYAVRYKNTIDGVGELLGLSSEDLEKWNLFGEDEVEAGSIIRVGKVLNLTPDIKYFLEENDLRNSFFAYTVNQGESLSSIASRYGTVEELLWEINDLKGEVEEGDEIFIYKIK